MEGIGITFLDPPYPKIGDGRIYSLFLREHSLLSPFPNCICSGLNPRLVETGRWGVYKGDIVLFPSFHCSDPTRSPSPRPDQILVQKWTTLVQKSICFLALSTCFFYQRGPLLDQVGSGLRASIQHLSNERPKDRANSRTRSATR